MHLLSRFIFHIKVLNNYNNLIVEVAVNYQQQLLLLYSFYFTFVYYITIKKENL